MKTRYLVALAVLAGARAAAAAEPAPKPAAPTTQPAAQPVQTEHTFEKHLTVTDPRTGQKRTETVRLGYLLFLPDGYAQGKEAGKRWPLILFLHGAGERGDKLDLVRKHGPPKLVEQRGGDFPFIIVSPQCPTKSWWSPEPLAALLDEVLAAQAVDADRIYVTGLSMGGFGTWALAAMQPQRFAAIAPICGGGDPNTAARIKDIPTWVFHGGKDRTVPVRKSEEMVEAMKKAGAGDVQLTVYPEAGHDSWTATYDDARLYQWLLSKSRSGKGAKGDQPKAPG